MIYFFTTGLCGKTSYKPFEDLAKETSGQMFELPKDTKQLSKMTTITKALLNPMTSATGGGLVFPGVMKRSASSEYRLPFDDTMEKVTVSVTTKTGDQ